MVLDKFGSGLKQAFRKVMGLGVVDKEAVEAVVKELQRTLLQADVDVKMVSELSNSIREKVLKAKLAPGMTLKEHFIKTLYDETVRFLGAEKGGIELKKQNILVIGLFGSGKTTTIGKLGKWFKTRGMKVGVVACDTHRPAAQDQLEQIAERVGVACYKEGKKPEDIAKNAIKKAGHDKDDVVIFDSAGRDALDKELARELKELGKITKPDEVLLVIPADIGQDARRQAEEFNKLVGITGVVVTKLDGTAKAGGALTASAVSGAKVKFIGVGEKPQDLEEYDPQRFVSKLIGYGDLQGLMEKAKSAGVEVDKDKAERLLKGKFTMEDFYDQIGQMQKMGSLSKVAEMIPGMGKMKIPKDMLDVQEGKMKKWKFIIDSMTKEEKENPEIIKAARIKRIAKGSGTTESDVKGLLKYYKQTQKVMKLAKGGKGFRRGPLAALAKQFGMADVEG
jgi:signal recognition particle subunit SRP54